MNHLSFELGDIIKWGPTFMVGGVKSEESYGMVIRGTETIKGGKYSYGPFTETDGEIKMTYIEPMSAITVFSFKDQKVVTLYRNPDDIPLNIEKVCFNNKKA
jgi:hypothetical protein